MVGTSPTGKGGIASVVAVMLKAGFLKQHDAIYIASHTNAGALQKALCFLRVFAEVFRLCLGNRPSLVHVHSSAQGSFIRKSLILALARSFGCKTIFHLHAGYFKQYVEKSGRLRHWLILRTLQKSDKVIALSESWASFLRDFAPGIDVAVIPNSVQLPSLSDPTLIEPYRILFLGDIVAQKGVFELLEAVSQLHAAFPDIQLALGGKGDDALVSAQAEKLGITQNVKLLGWVEAEQKQQELARAAIFALPSYVEGLPMSMLEAMAAGKAVIVTPVGGIPEVIADGHNGLLIPIQDAQSLAFALKKLFENPPLLTQLGMNARETVAKRYSSEIVLSALSAIYKELGVDAAH